MKIIIKPQYKEDDFKGFIKINYKDFNKYALTSFFYEIKPIVIFYKGNILKIICEDRAYTFKSKSFKILKDIGTLKGYQTLPFKKINNNFYTSLNKEVLK